MVFLGIYRALYDYTPQADTELAIQEGDLLFVLDKSTDDDWWKAKKKAQNENDEEPEGLIPNNYVEEATPIHKAKALYDYTRQTDEELSFSEEAILDVYDVSDPDWTLVGLNGEYGFAPSNYIEITDAAPAMPPRSRVERLEPQAEPEPESPPTPSSGDSPVQSPAAALAGIIAQKTGSNATGATRTVASPPPAIDLPPRRPQYTPEESDEEQPAPKLPQRPPSEQLSPPSTQYATPRSPDTLGAMPSPPYNRASTRGYDDEDVLPSSPAGFHLYNIHEMVSHMGKNKKMPMTLGINVPKGIIMISPEKSRDGPQKEWTAEKLTHYSLEGKHVFMELVRPSKSIDFHAGAKDTAQEIVSALGELAGAARAEGLREVLAAGSGSGPSNTQKKGQMLFDFMAQGDDEVTVAAGDEVIILDDTKSDEWWMVRRLKNGKEGVVPSNYVEVTGTVPSASPSTSGINAGRSIVEQNRLEEERLVREVSRAHRKREEAEPKAAEVGPGVQLPDRSSSLVRKDNNALRSSQRSKRDSQDTKRPTTSKSKPDASKTRTWTDRTGSFKVEAEFIGLKDGKIHLHKLNGVKIAVPVPKMSTEDLEYVERVTGVSLDEDKPLSEIKRRGTQRTKERTREPASSSSSRPKAGTSAAQPTKPEYDWFDFFLQCGVNPQICERYASAFTRDQMGEEVMPDVSPQLLRTLGLKEGDILRVMKFLDAKFGRTAAKEKRNVSFADTSVVENGEDEAAPAPNGTNGATGGLFSGPGGTLRNNTRKGRPAPAVQTSDVVDPKAFEQKKDDSSKKPVPADATATPLASAPMPDKKLVSGFDDNAWEPRESKTSQPAAPPATAASFSPAQAPASTPAPPGPAVTGSLAELSLLSPPLQPTPAPQQSPQPQPPPPAPQQPLPPGATPSLFDQLAQQPFIQRPPQQTLSFVPQQTGVNQPQSQPQPQQQQYMAPRQRPQAPQQLQSQGSLIAPPPPRASSAPQNVSQPSAFGPPPLQPQLTGYQGQMQAGISPPGQSLQELNQQRLQQGFPPQQPGFTPPNQGFGQIPNAIMPQPTGFGQFPQTLQAQSPGFVQVQQPQPIGFQQPQPTGFAPTVQQQFINGQQTGSPFADPPRHPFQPLPSQPTGMQPTFSPQPQLQPQATGINAFLPPPLQPQRTGFASPSPSFGQAPPPVPPIPQQPSLAPLQPQKTGPPPPVRFGVGPAAKLTPQPTGRRANLSQATPQNPFGF